MWDVSREVRQLCPKFTVLTLLKKPTWDPHGTHVETMWVPCGILVGPCGNHVGTMWDPCGSLWEPCGPHMTNLKKK